MHHYDFAHARHIVDVGGAHGDLLLTILQASPHARGTVFDLPHVADAARQAIAAHGYAARCEAVGGDFFQAVPPGGDVYILKLIVHDWPDTEAVRILHTCRAAMPPDGTLLVIEMVIPDDPRLSLAHMSDLNMLVMTGGQERTAREYGALLAQAGSASRAASHTARRMTCWKPSWSDKGHHPLAPGAAQRGGVWGGRRHARGRRTWPLLPHHGVLELTRRGRGGGTMQR